MIYMDNAATSWPKPEAVYEAVNNCMRNLGANPGRGGHKMARAASHIVYEAREELAMLLGCDDPGQIAFAYNATDAINTALFGLLKPGDSVVTTAMEHNAVARPLRQLAQLGVTVSVVACDQQGMVDMKAMEQAIAAGTTAVVMSHASNVTGTIMPIYDIGLLTKAHGAVFIVDGAQTVGVEEVNVTECSIDILTFSGHKGLLGPQGTAGLYVRPGLTLTPRRFGGTGSMSESDQQPQFMPDCLESGTPNTPGLAGLAAGVRFIRETGRAVIKKREAEHTARLLTGLAAIPQVTVYGPSTASKRTAVVSFTIDGMDSGEVAHRLDVEYGIACRSGLHCAPWAHQTIGTKSTGTVRFSPGYFTTAAEVEQTITAVQQIVIKECKR